MVTQCTTQTRHCPEVRQVKFIHFFFVFILHFCSPVLFEPKLGTASASNKFNVRCWRSLLLFILGYHLLLGFSNPTELQFFVRRVRVRRHCRCSLLHKPSHLKFKSIRSIVICILSSDAQGGTARIHTSASINLFHWRRIMYPISACHAKCNAITDRKCRPLKCETAHRRWNADIILIEMRN